MSFKLPKTKTKLKHSKSAGDVVEANSATQECNLHIQALLFPRYNTATWMNDLYKDHPAQKINEIVIPGSHDSATDQMTKKSMYASFNKMHRLSQDLVCSWAKTQHHSIYEQLMDGIRYLDLRIENHPTGWKTFHGLICNDLNDVLEQIGRYATNHKREIIIIDFQHLVNFEFNDHIKLMEFIIRHESLGARLAGNHLGADGTLLDYWKADKNVIVFYCEGYRHFSHLYWSRAHGIQNPWYNTHSKSTLQEKLVMGIQDRQEHQFYVSQLVLTPDALKIVTGLLTRGNLYNLTVPSVPELIRNGLLERIDTSAKQVSRTMNIVIVDFYEHSSFVATCLDINTKNLQS